MDNKLFKRIVAVAASAVMLTSSAFATVLSNVTYEDGNLGFSYDPANATKVTYLAYAAKAYETTDEGYDAITADYTDTTNSTKYVFGEIVAVNQIDSTTGDALTAPTEPLTVPVNEALLVLDDKDNEDATDDVKATHIVLMSGADNADTADVEVVTLVPAKVEYTITFDVDGTTSTATTVDGKVTAPAAPVKDGHTFKGWGTTADATTVVDLSTEIFAADTTLYAIFEANAPTYTTNVISNVFGQTGAKVIRYYGIGAGKVVTVDGVTAKAYTNPATEELVYIVAIPASENEPVVTITDGTTETILFGDVNEDGSQTTKDTTTLKYSLTGKSVTDRTGVTTDYVLPTDLMKLIIFDVNGDGSISTKDTTTLKYSLTGKSVTDRTGVTTDYALNNLGALIIVNE